MLFQNFSHSGMGQRAAHQVGQAPTPVTTFQPPQTDTPTTFVLPEDRPRVGAELICKLRGENRTEAEITDILRKTLPGITDEQIVAAFGQANAVCPVTLSPIFPPQAEKIPPTVLSDRDIADRICLFRTQGVPEDLIPNAVRQSVAADFPNRPDVTDAELSEAFAAVANICPPPIRPDEPTVVTVPVPPEPSRVGKFTPWLVAGGIAIGIITVAVVASKASAEE